MGVAPLITPEVLDSLYRWLSRCAESKDYCPTNQAICERFGFKSWSTAVKAISKLQVRGDITVMRSSNVRQVYIVKTQRMTPMPPPPPKTKKRAPTPAPVADRALQPDAKEASDAPDDDTTLEEMNSASATNLMDTAARISPIRAPLDFGDPNGDKEGVHESRRRTHLENRIGNNVWMRKHLNMSGVEPSKRAAELRQMAEFEAAGKVKRCDMGDTAFEQDENGIYINPAIRKRYQSSWMRSRRAGQKASGAQK